MDRTYDAAGRLTGFATDGVGALGVTWAGYTQDLDGRATDLSVTGSGATFSTWDAAARLSTVSSRASGEPSIYTDRLFAFMRETGMTLSATIVTKDADA